jgi:transcriptional regulator with XRE-family HTH domain
MSVNQRIVFLYESLNLDQKEFCKQIGLNYKTINAMIKKDTPPKHDVLLAILEKFPIVSPEWLVIGYGDVWKSEKSDNKTLNNLITDTKQIKKRSIENGNQEQYEQRIADLKEEISFLRKQLDKKL